MTISILTKQKISFAPVKRISFGKNIVVAKTKGAK